MTNEKRLIDAYALAAEFMELADTGIEFDGEGVANAIANAPTVDAAPVVHGRWIETEEGTICSECHEHPFEDGYFAIANYNGDWCPNCGAKMDGDKHES